MPANVSAPRLLTSAVAIHATACFVALFAVGPRQADASYDYLKIDGHLRAIPEFDRSNEPAHARFQHIQKIAASDMVPSTAAVEWDEVKFDSQLEATSNIEDSTATDLSALTPTHAEFVIAAPPDGAAPLDTRPPLNIPAPLATTRIH